MNGARDYAVLFPKAIQVKRLYILPHYHARGKTFRIFVLPAGEDVIENAGINPPLNKESVEVYGVISGNPGWTECYGWKHTGEWQKDFEKIVTDRREEILEADKKSFYKRHKEEDLENKKIDAFLAAY